MNKHTFQAFTDALTASLESDPHALGLIAMGSMANTSRLDAYSDHDFFVVAEDGWEDHYRQNFDWLPNHDDIVLAYRETAHGLKVLYKQGHLLEYASFSLQELDHALANDYAVLVDKADIAERMAQIKIKTEKAVDDRLVNQSDQFHFGQFICLLYVGCGRYARGEHISGHVFVKQYALGHLLSLLPRHITSDNVDKLDNLDAFRRIEQVFPEIGAEIDTALLKPVPDCALALLALGERLFKDTLVDYPADAVVTIREYIEAIQLLA